MRTMLAVLATAVAAVVAPTAPAAARTHFQNPETVKRAALADVRRRLRAAEVPPGSKPLDAAPKGSELGGPGPTPITPNALDRHRVWSVPGSLDGTIAWIRSHPPDDRPVKIEGSGGYKGKVTVRELIFEWGATKFASSRQLRFAVGTAANGRTILRVDSQAVWIEPHAASAVLPSSVRRIEVELDQSGGRVSRKTITSLPTIWRVAAAIAEFPAVQPGETECGPGLPSDFERVTMVFRDAAGDVVAEAKQRVLGSWCYSFELIVEGRRQPLLDASLETLKKIPGLLP